MSIAKFPSDPLRREKARAWYRLKRVIAGRSEVYAGEPNAGVILILPVVRVDREDDTARGRRRRSRE